METCTKSGTYPVPFPKIMGTRAPYVLHVASGTVIANPGPDGRAVPPTDGEIEALEGEFEELTWGICRHRSGLSPIRELVTRRDQRAAWRPCPMG